VPALGRLSIDLALLKTIDPNHSKFGIVKPKSREDKFKGIKIKLLNSLQNTGLVKY